LGWLWTAIHTISASWVARIAGVIHFMFFNPFPNCKWKTK
jgi:hypothetical protein